MSDVIGPQGSLQVKVRFFVEGIVDFVGAPLSQSKKTKCKQPTHGRTMGSRMLDRRSGPKTTHSVAMGYYV
ncbi:MAG: hypothetical protein ACYDHG_15400 [Desulfomonilaceae bacterium]